MGRSLEVTAKDKGYDIRFTAKDPDGNPYDLSAASAVSFAVRDVENNRLLFENSAQIISPPTAGMVKYTVQEDDFKKAGNFNGALVIDFGASKRITTEPFFLTVNRPFGE